MPNLNNKPTLKTFRKQLRNNSTSAEATLWNYLKNSQLEGRKFRRQHSIENYILDFFLSAFRCPSEKLAIELDGNDYFSGYGQTHDEIRDKFLNLLNIKALRFENKAIFERLKGVLEEIKGSFKR